MKLLLSVVMLSLIVMTGCANKEVTVLPEEPMNNDTSTEPPQERWHHYSWTLELGEFDEHLISEECFDGYCRATVVKDNYTITKIYTQFECLKECKEINMTSCAYFSTTCEKVFNISDVRIKFIDGNDGRIFVQSDEDIQLFIDFDGYSDFSRWMG